MIHVGVKRTRIRLLYVAIAALIVGGAFSTYAQLTSQSYTVRTVHVFPSEITAAGFENIETLTYQNLEEYALLQDFNTINSAYLGEALAEESPNTATPESDTGSTTDGEVVVIPVSASTTGATTTPGASTATVDAATTTTAITATTTDDDPAEAAATTSTPAAEESAVPAATADEVVNTPAATPTEAAQPAADPAADDSAAGTTTVSRLADQLFRLAIDTSTTTFFSTTTGLDTLQLPTTSSPLATLFAATTTATSSLATTSTTTLPVEPAPTDSPDSATTTPLNATTTTTAEPAATTSQTLGTTSQPAAPREPQAAAGAHVITLENFGYPLDEGVELSGAQLRLSFAAMHDESHDTLPQFTINYSLDQGDTWSTGGAIVIDGEVSNSLNGGYYLFALPALTDQAALQDLRVELRFDNDAALVDELFVESVWLELFVLEPPAEAAVVPLSELLGDDGYRNTKLSGDVLELGVDEPITFDFTDDTTGETLIVSSNQKTYKGLSEATTYFSVTNESDRADTFTVQTYFPGELGEVTGLSVLNVNQPYAAIVPEYRPYRYHCEAGWQPVASATPATLSELSIVGSAAAAEATSTASTTADVSSAATTTPTTTSPVATSATSSDERLNYVCQQTSVERSCESLEGDATACVVTEKVTDHHVTRYAPGWDTLAVTDGAMRAGGVLERVGSLLGFGPTRKAIPDGFVARSHSAATVTVAPGETRYFQLDIAFPPFSAGEYWIEVVGDREYGLLDPFWSSDWQYRMPLGVVNPTSAAQTDFQVKLELDSTMSDFWANVDVDGDDIRFVQEVTKGNLFAETAPTFDNAYNPAWSGRVALSVAASAIDGSLADFPVYVNLADLGADFWAGVQADGRDIRVTQQDGKTEVPYDLVSINTAAQTGELHFLAPRLDSGTDTTFHIYYNNPAATAYAPGDAFGRHAVWASYEAVYHFEDDPTTVGNIITDASGKGKDLVVENAPLATTTGQLGAAIDLTGTSVGILRDNDWALTAGNDHVSSGWHQQAVNSAEAIWQWGTTADPNWTGYMPWYTGGTVGGRGYLYFGRNANIVWDRTPIVNRWTHFTTVAGNTVGDPHRIYENNTLRMNLTQSVANPFNNAATGLQVGRWTTGGSYNGSIDELRFEFDTTRRTDAWIAAEFTNQATSTDFYATSTQLAGGEALIGWFDTSWNQRQSFAIDTGAVAGTQTDFPVYVDLSLFGADFFAGVAADGADIRVTKADGKTELPFELVGINTGSQTGELYFKDTISGGETYYLYFDNEDAAAYARDAAYGSENVWTNGFRAVYHFEEDAAGTGNVNLYQDSTSNRYHADDETTSATTTGRLGQGVGFGAGVIDAIEPPNDVLDGVSDYTVSWWHNTTQTTDASIVSAANGTVNNEFLFFFPTPNLLYLYNGQNGARSSFNLSDTVGTFNTGAWQHFMVAGDAVQDDAYLFANGRPDAENGETSVMETLDVPNGGLVIAQEQDVVNGSYDANQRFIGQLDEMRFATVVRDANWARTEYDNMNDPAAFFATSSVEQLTTTEFVELDYWLLSWDHSGQTATVWVQVADLPVGETQIYAYYGNNSAPAVSNEMAPFSYDTPQDIYYIVEADNTRPITIMSLIDNNQVAVAGAGTTSLNAGEVMTVTGYSAGDVVSVLGPITSKPNDDEGEPVVPISWAATTFVTPSNRHTLEEWHTYAPFAPATVEFFTAAGGGTAVASTTLATGGTNRTGFNVPGGNAGVVEATSPILLYHDANNNDSFNPYPVSTEDLYGFHSNDWYISTAATSSTYDVYCESGASAVGTQSVARGIQGGNNVCPSVSNSGPNSAVRVTNQSQPVGVIQQADSDGNESTSFWPDSEFGTQYYVPVDADYVSVICAPSYPAATLAIYNAGATTPTETATCTPTATNPDSVRFTNGGNGNTLQYAAGTRVASTNGVPFYTIYDHTTDDDEANNLGSLQGRKYGAAAATFVSGEQEEANAPNFTQLSYWWFENAAQLQPTSSWPLGGGETVFEGQRIAGAGAVADGDVLRLRMNVQGGNATATIDNAAFGLQYAAAAPGQCSAVTVWNDVGQVGSTTAAFSGYNNPGVADGTTLATSTLASTTVLATYEERNYSNLIPNDIGVGAVAEWDWVLTASNIVVNQTYCFRMVRESGQVFDVYTTYPELETVGPPNTPVLTAFFDNEHTAQLAPTLQFVASDIAGDDIHYEVQVDDDITFSSVDLTSDSAVSFLDFTNVSNPADKAPFTSGAPVRFVATSDLASSTTYWWRVRATDPAGSATSSAWSEPFSFTTNQTVTVSEWLQTTAEQFSTNELISVSTSSGQAALVGATGVMNSTGIDFDDATVGNAWGTVSWNSTEVSGTTSIQIEYNDNGTWTLVPDAALPGNAAGFIGGPVNILELDTNIYNEIRLVANFSGGTASLQDWTVRWGQRVEIPTQGDLFDNQKTANTVPVFDFISSDPQGDDLQYEISFSTDFTFTSGSTTFNSATDPGFANAGNGADTAPFTSGDTVTYTTQPGAPFADGTTYWWRTRAKDPAGGDAWSPWATPDAFTIDTGVTLSTWFQTTRDQFNQGELVGTTASTSDAVVVSEDIGEYGTVTLTNNNWVTVNTTLRYRDMVVVVSPEYDGSAFGNNRNARVRNKTEDSFEVKVDDYTNSFSGTTVVDFMVIEAGTWTVADGGSGTQLIAGTAPSVSAVQARSFQNNIGTAIDYASTPFSSAPVGIATVSSDNDTDWIGAHMDGDGADHVEEITTTRAQVALNASYGGITSHGPEDIDYVIMDVQNAGTVGGVAFKSFNSSDSVDDTQGQGGHNQTFPGGAFSSTPQVTLVQNNAEDGGDGGFAIKDTSGTSNASQIFLSLMEGGAGANGHTQEIASVIAFEAASGIIKRDIASGALANVIAGEDIIFSDGAGPKFSNFAWSSTSPGASVVTVQMQYRVSPGVYALIPDAALPGNSTGFTASSIDLTSIDINTYDQIRPFATLTCAGGVCPQITDWQLEWSEGVNMSGTLQEYDRLTAVATGTIRAAVNGVPVGGSGSVAGGVWTLNNVTAFAGDIVTVWVDGAAEADEAVTAFIYDGLGDISGVKLYEQHLAFDADEFGGSLTNQLLGLYDNTDDEDIMFAVDGLQNLTMCGSGTCADANIYVGAGQTYIPATSTAISVSTHDFINNGTIELDANTFNVSGSWDNNATSTTDTSIITMTAATGTESITSVESPLDFHTVNFGGFGAATFTIDVPLDLSGNLSVATGTLARDGFDITVGGSVSTALGGVWQGTGTTTFDGSGAHTWSDGNPTPQNIGNVVVDGASKIITITSDVAAYDVRIGANDTLVGGAGTTIYVAGDWINTGTFTADTSTVEIVNDDRTYPPIVPGSADWYSDTTFTKRVPLTIQSSEVGDDLTNFPLFVDLATLGADFWSGVQADGRDIRITSGNGQTELPHDLVWIDSAAQDGELHFLADSVSSSTNTTFYVYFNNPAAAAYGKADPYGREAVWTEYEAVYHFEGDPAAGYIDYSGNNRTVSVTIGTAATTSGPLGQALDTTASNVMLEAGDFAWTAGDDLVSSGLYFMSAVDNGALWQFGNGNGSNNGTYLSFMPNYDATNRGRHFFGITSGADYTVNPYNNTVWHHFTTLGRATVGEQNEIYEDAVLRDTVTQIASSQNPANSGLKIGRYQTTTYSEFQLDELRFASTTRSADWIESEHINQTSPTVFYATSSIDNYVPPMVIDEATHTIAPGGSAFYTLRFADATTSPVFSEPSVVVNNDFVIATGTVPLPSGVLTIGGSFLNSGYFMHNNAEVAFTGSGAQTVQLQGTTFLNALHLVRFDGSGTWTFTDATATVTDSVLIEDGTVVFPTTQLSIGGTLDVLPGGAAFDNATGTVRFVSGQNETVRTSGSAFYNVVFGEGALGWYGDGWTTRIAVTIDPNQVPETLTNYPMYLNLANLGAEFWGAVAGDGDDIRVTTVNGESEVPHELVSIDLVAQTGELHFLAPTVSSVASTTYYVYVGNAQATAYDPTDPYGRNNVWTGYEAVYHFASDPAGTTVDVSGNGRDMSVLNGSPATTSGPLGQAFDSTASNVSLSDGDWTWQAGDNLISSGLYFMANTDNGALWQFGVGGGSNNGTYLAFMPNYDLTNRGRHFFGITSGGDYTVSGYDNTIWHHFTTIGRAAVGEQNEIYEDAVLRDTVTQIASSQNPTNTGLRLGSYQGGTYTNIQIDELRFATTTPQPGWVTYEHKNLAQTETLYTVAAEPFLDAITSFTLNESVTTAEGDVTLQGARLVAPSDTFFIGGSAQNTTGVYDPNNATTTFNSTDLGETFDFGDVSFYNLAFDGAGGGWTVGTTTVANNLTLATGASYVQATGTVMTVEGIFSNQFASAATDWTDSTLVLTGGDYEVTGKGDAGDTYATVQVSGDTDIVIWNSQIATSSILDNSSIYMPDFAGIDGQLNIYGQYERATGSEYWSYATDFDGADLTGGSERQANVYLEGGTTITMATGTVLQMTGGAGATTTVQSLFGIYSTVLNGATLDASRVSIVDAGPLGLELRNGTTIATLEQVDFAVAPGRSGITVDATTVNAQPSSNYQTVNFATTTGGTIYKSAWTEQMLLTVHASSVTQTINNFPVYLDLSVLGDTFWAGVRSDGGDIRMTTDLGREIAIDMVEIDVAAKTGELHFLAPTLSAVTDTTFYVHYNNPAATAYAPSRQYGANAVWAGYEAVYHFAENPTTGITDMTGNGRMLSSAIGVPATTSGLIGTALDTTASNVMLTDSDWTWQAGDDLVSSGLYYMSNFDTGALWEWGNCTSNDCIAFMPWWDNATRGYHRFGNTGGNDYNFTRSTSTYHHFTTIGRAAAGQQIQIFEDNVQRDYYVQSAAGANPSKTGLKIGRYTTGTYTDIDVDELRFTTIIPTDTWRQAEYSNLTNAAAFYATSSGPTATYNVTTDGVPATFWLFSNGVGNLYGEAFDNDDGDPGSMQWDDSDYNITISGVVYADDGVTPQGAPVCNGSTQVVTVVIEGGATFRAACDPTDGSYEITGIVYNGEPKITAYIDSNAPTGQVNVGVASSTTGVGTVTAGTFTITRPAVEDDMVLVALVGKDDEIAVTPPAGWTALSTLGTTAGDDIFTGAWYRVVSDASTEPATYTFSADSGEGYAWWVGALVNVDTASPVDVASSWVKYQNAPAAEAPSVTTVTNGALALASWYVFRDSDVTLPNTTWKTQVSNLITPEGDNLSVQSRVIDTAGPTDALYANNIFNVRESQAGQFVFRPAATVSATGSIVAAVVTKTPIGAGSDPYRTITIRDQRLAAATISSGGTVSVERPAVAKDDVLVVVLNKDDNHAVTAPAGWTKAADRATVIGSRMYSALWYKVITDPGSEPATYNFTNNDTSAEEVLYWAGSFENVDTASVFDVSPVWNNVQNVNTATATSITTVTPGAYVLAAWGIMFDNDVTMPGGAWTTLAEDLNISSRALNVAGRRFTATGATGDVVVADASVDDVNLGQFALRPAPAAVAEGIFDMDLYQHRVIVRHEDNAPLTIADMNTFDSGQESDLPFTVATTGPNTLDVTDGNGLFVWHNKTFAPAGIVTLLGDGDAVADGSLTLGDAATYTSTGTNPIVIGGSFYTGAGATFSGASSLVSFTAATSGQSIAAAGSSTVHFYDVQFTGAGGGWAVQTPMVVDQDVLVATGTVSGSGDITVVTGDFSGNGLVNMTGGTVQVNTDNTLGGTTPWSFYNLTLGDGSTSGVTTPATNATTTVYNQLRIASGHFLDAGASVWDLAGSGAVFVESGTFLEDTSTVRYSGTTPAVLRTAYHNLVVGGESGPVTATAPVTGLQVLGDLTVAGTATATLDLATNDPLTAVGGAVYIGTTGEILASDVSDLRVFGSWDNDGSFVANDGQVSLLQAAGTATVAAGASPFATLTIGGAAAYTLTESATATADLTLGTSQFTLQAGETLAVGGAFANNMPDTDTTWAGTTLYLYGGGEYLINPKTVGDTYNTIRVASGTHPRLWNATVTTINTDPGGSLYSMDHGEVDGRLQIYGDFVNTAFTDEWSYANDFDGVSLAVPRAATVLVEPGGSVTYEGGGLTMRGTSTASTTVDALAAGTYSLTLGGTTTVDLTHYQLRDLTASGLVLSGSPAIVDLSYGDFEPAIAGASALTVGGTVINANQARNFTNNRFATTTPIAAHNVTATGTAVSSWRFVNVIGNLDGEALDVDPGGDPGYIVWQDSAAIIDITGTVYESDRTTVSSVCDGVTNNVRLSIQGLTFASTTCNATTGAYTFTGIGFGPSDTLLVYLDGAASQAANVTKDPISLINNMDLYENHVIVRHEGVAPMTVAAMSVYDSSDDADIPFTAVTGTPDSLTLPSNTTLLVWTDKTFAPQGDVTIAGSGGGASYDGTLELLADATYDADAGQTLSIGGSLLTAPGATFDADLSTTTFTAAAGSWTIDTNDSGFHNLALTGSATWTLADSEGDINGDLRITGGTLALPAATTTVTGSFENTGGAFTAAGSTLVFDAPDTGNVVTWGGSAPETVRFEGAGAWAFGDVNATTTGTLTVATGTVTLPSGTLSIAGDLVVTDTVAHNGGTVALRSPAPTAVLTLGGNDLHTLLVSTPTGVYTATDASLSLLGNLTIATGSLAVGTGTTAVGGSFDVSGGTFVHNDGTVLLNAAAPGQFIDPGANELYNLVVAGSGGWTLADHATVTNNLNLSNAGSFTVAPGSIVVVDGVFTNNVGGAATTWTDTTLVLRSGTEYEVSLKTTPAELYGTVEIGANTDVSLWNSSAATTTVASTASLYSQDHAGVDGSLYIFGDYVIATTTEFWSAATDFDGAALGVSRPVAVAIASSSAVTVTGTGGLQLVGEAGATTTVANQGTGAYNLVATGGSLTAQYFSLTDLTAAGWQLGGTTAIAGLSQGYLTQTADDQTFITLASTTLNVNAGLVVTNVGFASGGFANGVNIALDATTTNSWLVTGVAGDRWGEAYDIDGTDDCSSIRWDDSACLLTEQAHYRWRNDNGGEGAASSTWFHPDWSARQRLRVTNPDAVAYASTAVSIVLPYNADMQSDFDDIRVTLADGVTLTAHWIERVQSGAEAIVWVQTDSLPAETTREFYVYYGNVSATSTSNGADVFTLIEDFEANDLTPYGGDTTLFNVASTYAYGGAYGLDTAGNENARATDGIARSDITVAQGSRLRFMQYVDTASGVNDEVCTLFATQDPMTNNDNYAICVEQPGVDRISIVRDVSDTEFSGTILASSTVTLATGWYEFMIDWQTDGTIAAMMRDTAGTVVATAEATDTTYTSGGIGFTYWFQHGGWDSVVAWPRTNSLPVTQLGSKQAEGGATWAGAQDTPTGGFLIDEVARLRVGIENTGLPITNQNFRLEYAPKLTAPACEAVAPASFVSVPVAASCGTNDVCMKSSTFVSNGAATTDHLVTDAGAFVAGAIVTDPANQTGNFDLAQNRYTELEYALALTSNATNDAYCFRVTNAGVPLDSYARLPELTLAFDPILDPVTLNDGVDIVLTSGTTTAIIASTTVTDFNGVADLVSATTTFYKTSSGAACTPNDNNCYVATSTCTFSACTATACSLQCVAPFAYHTDPTDLDGGEEWFAFMEVRDTTGASDFSTSGGVEVLTLRAMGIENAIAYGVVDVNQNTGSFNPDIQLLNIGNESIDVQVSGTDMTDGVASVIPAAQQLFATSTFTYAACAGCSPLTVTPVTVEVDLDKPVTTTPAVRDEIYWGIEVPFGTASNPHTGMNFFTAIAD